jgi:uncharacterized protein (TIGR02594 family)
MNILEKFLEIAKGEMGVHREPDHHSKRIIEYDATTTLKATNDMVPWCSSFVNWVVTQAGEEGTNSAAARSWLDWGKKLSYPEPGCIVVLKRGKDATLGHVGFYIEAHSPYFTVLGGNQNNMVCDSTFIIGAVLGYRVPLSYEKE